MTKEPSVKILVGYHKPACLFKSDVLVPIHLGRALATEASKDGVISEKDYQWMLDNMIGDDTGDNISKKNRLYAELTSLYWAWKNYDKLGNPDYIGLVHYRRLLNFSNDKNDETFKGLIDSEIVKQCSLYDVILSTRLGAWSNQKKMFIEQIFEQYSTEHNGEDLKLFEQIIKAHYPQMSEAVDTVLYHSSKISWYGIFVMKKELFFEYSEFAFDVFKRLEKKIKWQKYPVEQQRVCGYLSEFLLNIFTEYKKTKFAIKTKTLPLYRIGNEQQSRNKIGIDIDVCFGTDNNYIRHTATAMASILTNANALDKYHFHILSENLSWLNKLKLNRLKKIRSFTVDYPQIRKKKLKIFEKIKCLNYINMSCYNRLLIPAVLPAVDKALYLDSDLLVLKDLNCLANEELGQDWFGGIEDINAPSLAKCIKLKDNKYINSGVLVMNTKALREHNYYEMIKETVAKNYQNYYLSDQDVLNDTFHDKIKLISYRYNMFFKFHHLLKNFTPSDEKDFKYSCENPVVVHFVGREKPWSLDNKHPYKDVYQHYLSLTPWANYKEKKHKSFTLFRKIKTPELKQVLLFNIPIKTVKTTLHKKNKRFLGLLYYKKSMTDTLEKESKFFGLIKKYKVRENVVKYVPSLNNDWENKVQIWKKFIFPYTLYGVSPTMLKLAEQFVGITTDTKMHILYMAMVLEAGDKNAVKNLLGQYIQKYGDKDFDKKLNLAAFAAQNGFYQYKNIVDSAEVYKLFEKTTNSALLENLFYNKSIAVVGNGPSHIGKKTGAEIDAHDIVIRMNNYDVDKLYQDDYGSKTDIWLVGCGGDDVVLRKDNFKAVIFGQDVRYFWGYHSDFYKYFILDKHIPCCYISHEILDKFHKEYDIEFTTTGANFIYVLTKILKNFKNVDFYGFNFCADKPDTYASHYFSENQSIHERMMRSKGHDFEKETYVLKKIVESKHE